MLEYVEFVRDVVDGDESQQERKRVGDPSRGDRRLRSVVETGQRGPVPALNLSINAGSYSRHLHRP
jgi:hypothetical protein